MSDVVDTRLQGTRGAPGPGSLARMASHRPQADTFYAADRAAWREWLAVHHAERTQVWLLLHKKHVEEPSVSYDEAVEEALCWGWIDGLTNRWDERSYDATVSRRASPAASGARATWRVSHV